jgi:hypothetical protein
MRHCSILKLLYEALPVRPWQAFLLRVHMDRCPACQAKLARRDEARRVLQRAEDFEGRVDLWPAIRGRLERAAAPSPAAPRFGTFPLRAAAGAALLLAAAGLSVLFWRGFKVEQAGPMPAADEGRFAIDYVRIAGRPADSFVFQAKEAKMTLIWASKKAEGGL